MKPEHIEESEHGMSCRHCGGEVGADGYSMAMGGLAEAEEHEGVEGYGTDQQNATEAMREAGFADAIKRRGYADGGMVLNEADPRFKNKLSQEDAAYFHSSPEDQQKQRKEQGMDKPYWQVMQDRDERLRREQREVAMRGNGRSSGPTGSGR